MRFGQYRIDDSGKLIQRCHPGDHHFIIDEERRCAMERSDHGISEIEVYLSFLNPAVQALIKHDENRSSDLLREAHALFDLITVCTKVLIPALREIGEAWYRGEIRVTTEHFASAYLRGKLLSLLQATLTLPGIAAIALALGMAIDANVLINERVREELRNGSSPQSAIAAGYERAFGTILDSNITTLIAGVALLAFGSGPVRGFAVVHCLGILTSIVSSVVVSRAIVNLSYGHRRRVARLAIGNTEWK